MITLYRITPTFPSCLTYICANSHITSKQPLQSGVLQSLIKYTFYICIRVPIGEIAVWPRAVRFAGGLAGRCSSWTRLSSLSISCSRSHNSRCSRSELRSSSLHQSAFSFSWEVSCSTSRFLFFFRADLMLLRTLQLLL